MGSEFLYLPFAQFFDKQKLFLWQNYLIVICVTIEAFFSGGDRWENCYYCNVCNSSQLVRIVVVFRGTF